MLESHVWLVAQRLTEILRDTHALNMSWAKRRQISMEGDLCTEENRGWNGVGAPGKGKPWPSLETE